MTKNNSAEKDDKWIGIGLIGGVVVGSLTDNLGLWIALGLVFGVALKEQNAKKTEQENKNGEE